MIEVVIYFLLLSFVVTGIVMSIRFKKRADFYESELCKSQLETQEQLRLVNMLKERVIGEKPLRKKLENG